MRGPRPRFALHGLERGLGGDALRCRVLTGKFLVRRMRAWVLFAGATLQEEHYGSCIFHVQTLLQDDGTCNACPVLKSAWDRYHTLLYILIIVAGIVALVWVGLLLLVRLRGGTLLGGAKRMLDLFVWGMLSAQVRASCLRVHRICPLSYCIEEWPRHVAFTCLVRTGCV